LTTITTSHLTEFGEVWEMDDADSVELQKKYVLEKLDQISEHKCPIFKRIKKGELVRNPKVKWLEENTYSNTITATLSSTTMTFSGNLLGAAITSEALKQHIHKYIVLRDGMQCYCAADPDYTAKTVTVAAHGNNSLSDDTGGAVTYRILGMRSSDLDTTFAPKFLNRKYRFCGTQISKYYCTITHSRRDMGMEVVGDEFAHQLAEIMSNITNQRAETGLLMEPVYSGGEYLTGLSDANPTMTGFLIWPKIVQAELSNTNVYVNMTDSDTGVAAPADTDTLNALVKSMWLDEKCDFQMGDWIIGMHPNTHHSLSDDFVDSRDWGMKETTLGYEVTHFHSKIGKTFELVSDPYVPEDILFVANMSKMKWGPYGKQELRIVTLAENEQNAITKKITFQDYGVVVRSPRQIGMLYGLPTS